MPDPAAPQPSPAAVILTLGCKLNLADSTTIARPLHDAGWSTTDRVGPADLVVVNTCSVTGVADRKSRHLVRAARRAAPGARVVVTGCMVETATPESIATLGADEVYRQSDQARLIESLTGASGDMRPPTPSRSMLRTRAFVAAQRGCNDVCAFCIVPRTRGRERSRPIDEVVEEVRALEAEGAKEVVITGTQLGAYGRDLGRPTLTDLVRALVERADVPRLRLSSVQPQDLTDPLIDLWKDRRLCRHFHVAVQSGSESVLERMRRRYNAREYRSAVERLRRAIPDVAITTDVIVGFPGETEAEFEESHRFCADTGFAGMHVFPYSERSGTLAAKMPGPVAGSVKRDRVDLMLALADEMAVSYRRRFLGGTAEVLWERSRPGEGAPVWEGLTDTYVRVFAPAGRDLTNQIMPVRLTGLHSEGLWGELPK